MDVLFGTNDDLGNSMDGQELIPSARPLGL
jgi:hypothetical protein